eukprot:TRINITY_DN4764_c2_g1_i1.p1 TRINITY_DN4764_c2_g1~~TRINITY_DN4764_c2_g1_i1.p1  ORF type:complete len:754 (-),score=122.62 TRINITY_DN4764_c2_g1_i1:266-2527(-)
MLSEEAQKNLRDELLGSFRSLVKQEMQDMKEVINASAKSTQESMNSIAHSVSEMRNELGSSSHSVPDADAAAGGCAQEHLSLTPTWHTDAETSLSGQRGGNDFQSAAGSDLRTSAQGKPGKIRGKLIIHDQNPRKSEDPDNTNVNKQVQLLPGQVWTLPEIPVRPPSEGTAVAAKKMFRKAKDDRDGDEDRETAAEHVEEIRCSEVTEDSVKSNSPTSPTSPTVKKQQSQIARISEDPQPTSPISPQSFAAKKRSLGSTVSKGYGNKGPHLSSKEQRQLRDEAVKMASKVTLRGLLNIGEDEDVTMLKLYTHFVRSDVFDYIACTLLVLNSLTIGAQTDYQAQNINQPVPPIYRGIEIFFCVVFTSELCARISVFRMQFFSCRSSGWGWNWFDTLLVTLQLSEEIFTAASGERLTGSEEEDSDEGNSNFKVLKLVRVLRLLRIVRVLRVVRFVAELRKIVYLIIGSFMSFIWTGVLLAILNYILAVFFTQAVADYKLDDKSYYPEKNSLDRYFGSTGSSILSLYKAITGGQDWEDMSNPLMEEIGWLLGVLFLLYVFFSVLVLLNLVTGVFVDGAMKLTKEDKEVDLLRKVKDAFHQADADSSSSISIEEFLSSIRNPAMVAVFDAIELSLNKAEELFRYLDTESSGVLTLEEFARGAVNLQMPAKGIDLAMLQEHQKWVGTVLPKLAIALDDIKEEINVKFEQKQKLPSRSSSTSSRSPNPVRLQKIQPQQIQRRLPQAEKLQSVSLVEEDV